MLNGRRLLMKQISPQEIIGHIRRKCVNSYAIYNFGHAGTLSRRYSGSVIEEAIKEFPDNCKVLRPIQLLEGIIRIVIIKKPDINPVSEKNIAKAKTIQMEIANLLEQEE